MRSFGLFGILIGIFFTALAVSSAQAFDYLYLQDSEFITTGVVDTFKGGYQLGSTTGIRLTQANIDLLKLQLIDQFDGEFILVEDPITYQEKLSQHIDRLSEYLCLQKEIVLNRYSIEGLYRLPEIAGTTLQLKRGSCYDDFSLTSQEGVVSSTLEGVGTLQVSSLSLLRDLAYNTSELESYLSRDHDVYFTGGDNQFFFDWTSNEKIIPLYDLTPSGRNRRTRKFDAVKVVVYTETDDFPFVSGDLSLAIFAQYHDTLIKITSPYRVTKYDLLEEVMKKTKSLFVYSIQEGIDKDILEIDKFQKIYESFVDSDENILQQSIVQNLVYYYLSELRENNQNPQKFIYAISGLLEKGTMIQKELQSSLEGLEVFL